MIAIHITIKNNRITKYRQEVVPERLPSRTRCYNGKMIITHYFDETEAKKFYERVRG